MPSLDTIDHNPDLVGGEKWPYEPPRPTGVVLSSSDVTDVNVLPHYQMRSDAYPQGIGIIINNKKFQGRLSERKGTDTDATALMKLFTHLGFYTGRFNDLTASEMKAKLKMISEFDHENYDCLMVAILTHGDEGKLYGTDCKEIPEEELTELFCGEKCPSLVGKPKVFILQACRGKKEDNGVTYDAKDGDDDKEFDYMEVDEEQHAAMFEKGVDETDG